MTAQFHNKLIYYGIMGVSTYSLNSPSPCRDGAVTAKRPKRSEGAPKALDGDGATGPASGIKGLKSAANDIEESGSIVSGNN